MADGTLKVGTIITSSGSGTITLGLSGETISVPSGATLDMSSATTTLSSSMKNTPYFYAYSSNGQTPSDGTWTVVELDAEHVDSNGAFDTSTYKFTVPSGQAGKYCIGGRVLIDAQADSNVHEAGVMIGVNGTKFDQSYANYAANYPRDVTHNTSAIIDLSVGDYVQLYGYLNDIGGTGMDFKGNSDRQTAMWGFKIIE